MSAQEMATVRCHTSLELTAHLHPHIVQHLAGDGVFWVVPMPVNGTTSASWKLNRCHRPALRLRVSRRRSPGITLDVRPPRQHPVVRLGSNPDQSPYAVAIRFHHADRACARLLSALSFPASGCRCVSAPDTLASGTVKKLAIRPVCRMTAEPPMRGCAGIGIKAVPIRYQEIATLGNC